MEVLLNYFYLILLDSDPYWEIFTMNDYFTHGIVFYVSIDKFSNTESIGGGTISGVYVTIVFVIGSILRGIMTVKSGYFYLDLPHC